MQLHFINAAVHESFVSVEVKGSTKGSATLITCVRPLTCVNSEMIKVEIEIEISQVTIKATINRTKLCLITN